MFGIIDIRFRLNSPIELAGLCSLDKLPQKRNALYDTVSNLQFTAFLFLLDKNGFMSVFSKNK